MDDFVVIVVGMFLGLVMFFIGFTVGDVGTENEIYKILINNPEITSIEILQELEKEVE